jgi:hypothetical protein
LLIKKDDKMKKFIISILAMISLAGFAIAGLDVSGDTYTTLAVSTSATNGTTVTAAVDISSLKGGAKIIVFDTGDLTANASTQQVVTVQTSTTGTSAWTNVSAPVFADTAVTATVEAENFDTQTAGKYLRLSIVVNGAAAVEHSIGAVIVSPR